MLEQKILLAPLCTRVLKLCVRKLGQRPIYIVISHLSFSELALGALSFKAVLILVLMPEISFHPCHL